MQDQNRNSLAIHESTQEPRVSLVPLFSLMYMMVDGSNGLDLSLPLRRWMVSERSGFVDAEED